MRKHGGGGNGRGFGGLATLFRLVRYGASTLVSAVVDVGFFVLFSSVLLTSLPDAPRLFVSTAAARVLSSLCNFFLNRFLVFGGEGRVAGSLWRYYTLWASLMVGTYLLTLGGTRLLPWPATRCSTAGSFPGPGRRWRRCGRSGKNRVRCSV